MGLSMMSIRHMYRILIILTCCAGFSSCGDIRFWESEKKIGGKDDSINAAQLLDIRNRAATIQTSLDILPKRDFNFVTGDTMISATLYGDAADPVMVDERWFNRSGTTGRYRYYYDAGLLFHFYGKSSLNLNPQGETAEHAEILLRVYFNEKGNMFEHEKKVNETVIEMEDNELPAVMRRSEALRLLAFTDSAGGFDTAAVISILHGGPGVSKYAGPARIETDDALAESDVAPPLEATSEAPQSEPSNAITQKSALQKKAPPQQKTPPQKTPVAIKHEPSATPSKSAPPVKPVPPKPAVSPVMRKPVQPVADEDADAVIPAHTHGMIPGPLSSSRVRFQKGSTGVTVSAQLGRGRHNEYVLRARRSQSMSVNLDSDQSDAHFRVFLDNSDISGERRSWTGTLPRYADYHIVVYIHPKSAAQSAGYTVTIGIQ